MYSQIRDTTLAYGHVLALDLGGNPHIVYVDTDGGGACNQVVYAQKLASTWVMEKIYSAPSGSWIRFAQIRLVNDSARIAFTDGLTVYYATRPSLTFTGFFPPISGADATGGNFVQPLRTFKLNSTIPVKFKIFSCSTPVLTGDHILQAVKFSDETTSEPPVDATPQDAATAGNQFRLVDEE